jgi:DnaJ-domain-containing protein 1
MSGNLVLIGVVVVAFIVGYSALSFIIGKVQKEAGDDAAQQGRTGGGEEDAWRTQPPPPHLPPAGPPPIAPPAQPAHLSADGKYAAVLGLDGPITEENVKAAYRAMLEKYDPARVSGLGAEFQRTASEKTREITIAYEYFRHKYHYS